MPVISSGSESVALARLPALDGLRGIAALLVVLTHASFLTGLSGRPRLAGHLLGRGDFGVAIFFALSGFLLYRLMVHEADTTGRVRLAAYAARRFARVVPAYWAALAALGLATRPEVRDIVLHAIGAHIYVSDSMIPAFGQSWSVATELSFYAALPFLVIVFSWLRQRRQASVMGALLGLLALTSVLGFTVGPAWLGEHVILERLLPWRAPHFLIGMVIAEAAITPRHRASRWLRRMAAQPGGCLVIAAAAYLASTTPLAGSLLLEPAHGLALVLRTFFASVVAGGLLLPLALGPPSPWSHLLSKPAARWLGTISYGVFLWHLPVLEAIYYLTGAPHFRGGILPLLSLALPISLALGALSHRIIELPASRLAARLTRHGREGQRHDEKDPDHSFEPGRAG